MDAGIDKKEQRKRMVRYAGRLALILFIGLSLYLFISSIILVFLTKSDKEIAVPHVVGKRFEDVYNSLVRKGLIPELKPYEVNDMDDGIILNQYPENGRIVFEGEKIKLVISRSKVFLPVPNIVGSKLPFAINKLKNIHYNDRSYAIGTGVISYIPSDKIAESVVIQQNPEAGEEISPDRKVNLLVSSGKVEGEMKMPELLGQSIDIGFDILLSKGVSVMEEIVITDSVSKIGIIESQTPKAGEAIQFGMLIKLKVDYYPQKEKPYMSYERVNFTIPSDEKEGIFEAYIDDSSSKRIRFSRKMKAGGKIDFLFKRTGEAKIIITNNKQVVETINIEPDEFN
jgi:beta-lactam-binding protein with PASTA domain